MKIKDCLEASNSLQKLVRQDLPLKTAFALMKLTDKVNEYLRFYGNEIEKKTTEEQRNELLNYEVEDLEKVIIEETSDIRLSACDIKALEKFITIGGEDIA